MGKNFSCNNVSGKRRVADTYATPYSLTRLFLDTGVLLKEAPTLEPACGNGAITKVLSDYGFTDVKSFDLEQGQDFLTYSEPVSQLITNPPYSFAYEFIHHAKEIVKDRFALLLPLSYLHGKRRFDDIWQDRDFGLRSVSVFTRYPLFGDPLREDGKHHTGMMVFAWYFWEKGYCDAPQIQWLDNNAYILKRGE
jgi:hypothetical protein